MEGYQISKKKILQITVPVLIVLSVAAIWFFRNSPAKGSVWVPDNPDFALHADGGINLERLKSYGVPIVLDFSADWCPPCRIFTPIITQFHADVKEQAIIKIVDVDALPDFTSEFPVSVIPTQIFFDANGGPYKPEDESLPRFIMYSDRETGTHALTAHEGIMERADLLRILADMDVYIND